MRLGKIIDVVLPHNAARKFHQISAILRGHNYGYLAEPSYNEDGLVTFHVCRFMQDRKFREAYKKGVSTGALRTHPSDIHWRAYIACWAAQRAMHLKGDFVECGVSLGLLSRTVVDYVDFGNSGKRFFLFDTYEGIPSEVFTDAEKSNGLNKVEFGYQDCYQQVCETFSPFKNVRVIKGKVPRSLYTCDIPSVAYLSIDMNNAVSEIAAVSFFWDKLVPGAIVVLDDYAYSDQFSEQHDSWDDFARSKGVSILTIPTGQGLIFKP